MKWIKRNYKIKPNKNESPTEQIGKIRGISDVQRFLNPSQEDLHDPYLIKNIQEASNRIIMAIHNKERICLSYDADADGLTATSTMFRYLSNYTDNITYIYNERNHGHGIAEQIKLSSLDLEKDTERIKLNKLNTKTIQESDLLIIIDSSSNDVEACKHIVEKWGKEIIILDHHAIEKENPHVLLVNPQQDGDEYPNKFLSGAGVVLKTMEVIEDTLGQVDPWQYIDLVAVGMYADVMRVDIPENRYIIMQGLRNMKNTGLVRILKGGKVDTFKLKGDAIGFTIAPLLNGVARMDNIKLAIDILLEDDDNICKKLRLKMVKINDERKEKQKEIVEQYMKNIDSSKKVLIVMDEQSSKGFNGIVAQQLSDKFKRPAIVGRLHKGSVSGSFRSYGGFDLKTFLADSCLVEEAMGHPQAGGITVKEENLEELIAYIENNLPELENKEQTVIYDLEMHVSEIGEYIRAVEQFNTLTGNGFYKILVRVNGITVESVDTLGKTGETRKVKTFDEMELIKFRVDENYASELGYFDEIDAVGQLGVNEFYNFALKQKICTNQLMLEDYQLN